MNAIRTAIYTKGTTAGNFNTSIGGRLYWIKAPQEPTFPFCVFFPVSPDHIEYYFGATSDGTQSIEDITIQFNIHSDTRDSTTEADTILGYLKTQFDFAALSITGYSSHKLKRENVYGPFWIEEDQSWVYSVTYELYLNKSA